jgi:hypothetical protein
MPGDSDVFSDYDALLRDADLTQSPWQDGAYIADLDLLRELLRLTLGTKQQSGRMAKAVDAWIAHELRRAGFAGDAVWPRTRQPRIMPAELAQLEQAIDDVLNAIYGKRRTTGVRMGMEEPYVKDLASHGGPESCVGKAPG